MMRPHTLTTTFLERHGLIAETATSAVAALDRLRAVALLSPENADGGSEDPASNPIDCIVSDHDIPGSDGIEFLREVRDAGLSLPFVLFTGRGNEEVAAEAISAGISEYLQKESGTDQYEVLANRIRNLVSKHRTERELAETRSLYKRLVEGNLVGIYVMQDGAFEYVNPAFAEIFGYEQHELIEQVNGSPDGRRRRPRTRPRKHPLARGKRRRKRPVHVHRPAKRRDADRRRSLRRTREVQRRTCYHRYASGRFRA
jgi:CheY-like chemotaxis protein